MKPRGHYPVWQLHRTDPRKNLLLFLSSKDERDAFCALDPRHRIPLQDVDGIPFCRVPEPDPPRVKWITYERREP
jgi:hypothetical protein